MADMAERLEKARKYVSEKAGLRPALGIVLGSGLGGFVSRAKIVSEVPYADIPGFPQSTVEGHKGQFVFGYLGSTPVVIMQGRVHYYEGYPMEDVVMPARLMGLLGAETLLLTNASGGINKSFHAGDFMIVTDHIASFVPNPLIGKNIDELGTRFPDMSEVYNKRLVNIIRETAEDDGIKVQSGVYLQLTGPSFETPAEIRMARTLGADAVGMSTAVEAIAANHMGLKVCAISCVCNLAAGMNETPLTHAEVQEAADRAAPLFKKLITHSIENISDELLTKGI